MSSSRRATITTLEGFCHTLECDEHLRRPEEYPRMQCTEILSSTKLLRQLFDAIKDKACSMHISPWAKDHDPRSPPMLPQKNTFATKSAAGFIRAYEGTKAEVVASRSSSLAARRITSWRAIGFDLFFIMDRA